MCCNNTNNVAVISITFVIVCLFVYTVLIRRSQFYYRSHSLRGHEISVIQNMTNISYFRKISSRIWCQRNQLKKWQKVEVFAKQIFWTNEFVPRMAKDSVATEVWKIGQISIVQSLTCIAVLDFITFKSFFILSFFVFYFFYFVIFFPFKWNGVFEAKSLYSNVMLLYEV